MKKNKAFILENLIIVVVVLILAGITYQQFALAKAKSRDLQRKSDLNEFSKIIRLYFADYGKLPSNELINKSWGKNFMDGTGYVYATSVPKEKYGKKEYCYEIGSDGVSFKLFAELENKNDVDCKKDGILCNGISYCYTDSKYAVETKE
jgi:Tfp pilus assembly protein PilE